MTARIAIPLVALLLAGCSMTPPYERPAAPIRANWPVGEVAMEDDGSAEILIDCEGFEWVTGWVLGLGRHAWIVGPDDARAAMRERIARVRAALPT